MFLFYTEWKDTSPCNITFLYSVSTPVTLILRYIKYTRSKIKAAFLAISAGDIVHIATFLMQSHDQ